MRGTSAPISMSVGQLGSLLIADGDPHTGNFGIIYALQATVIAELISSTAADGNPLHVNAAGSGTWATVPLPAGAAIYGHFTSITLTSGTVIAYNI